MSIRKKLARIKRKLLQPKFIQDKKFPAYWFNSVLGKSEAYIVQVGSNDGKSGDPLYELISRNNDWKGLFVEPIPYLFDRLKDNYSFSDRFVFENVAINNGESMNFYWVNERAKLELPDAPYWIDQLGSFEKQHILKHLDGILEPYIETSILEGISLKDLFSRNDLKSIDILHIDTEGFDWMILSQLELEKFSPHFILYESHHLSEGELKASKFFLKNTYALFQCGIDILAVKKTTIKSFNLRIGEYMNEINA